MEKRRVAPGYLDTGIQMLEPTRKSVQGNNDNEKQHTVEGGHGAEQKSTEVGDELDRVFGKMTV